MINWSAYREQSLLRTRQSKNFKKRAIKYPTNYFLIVFYFVFCKVSCMSTINQSNNLQENKITNILKILVLQQTHSKKRKIPNNRVLVVTLIVTYSNKLHNLTRKRKSTLLFFFFQALSHTLRYLLFECCKMNKPKHTFG